jgi:hypothetical protein
MQIRNNIINGLAANASAGEPVNELFEEWRGGGPQIGNVTLIGVRH